eukprot:6183166-Pleurochrysis_carterae.AAC.2
MLSLGERDARPAKAGGGHVGGEDAKPDTLSHPARKRLRGEVGALDARAVQLRRHCGHGTRHVVVVEPEGN